MATPLDLLRTNVGASLMRLGSPMLIGLLSMTIFQITDLYFLSQISTVHAAAMTYIFPVTFIFAAFAMGLSSGISVSLGRSLGGDNAEHSLQRAGTSLLLAVFLGLTMGILSMIFFEPLMHLSGAKDTEYKLIQEYLTLWLPALPFFFLPMAMNSLFRAHGHARLSGLLMASSALLNIALDILLIFGPGIFPRLEMAGAAWATILSRFIISVIMLYFLFRKRIIARLPPIQSLLTIFREILHIGLPATVSTLLAPLSSAWMLRLLSVYGTDTVAGAGIAWRIESFWMMPLFAASQSLTPFLSGNLAAGKMERVHAAIRYTVKFSLFYGIALYLLLAAGGKFMGLLFSRHLPVLDALVLYFLLSGMSLPLFGIHLSFAFTFNSLKLSFVSLLINAGRFLVFIPLSYFFSFWFGLHGLFLSSVFSWLLSVLVSFITVRYFLNTVDKPRTV